MSPTEALRVAVGIDIGQKHDPTTICVAELDQRLEGSRTATHYLVRHLERLPLNLPYPELVRRLAQRLRAVTVRCAKADTLRVLVDATGVGQPVFDQLVALRLGVHLVRVTLTRGQTHDLQPGTDFPTLRLGKGAFTSKLQAVVQGHRLHSPRTPKGVPWPESFSNSKSGSAPTATTATEPSAAAPTTISSSPSGSPSNATSPTSTLEETHDPTTRRPDRPTIEPFRALRYRQ